MLIYATKETPFQQYIALKMHTFSYSSYPFFLLLNTVNINYVQTIPSEIAKKTLVVISKTARNETQIVDKQTATVREC